MAWSVTQMGYLRLATTTSSMIRAHRITEFMVCSRGRGIARTWVRWRTLCLLVDVPDATLIRPARRLVRVSIDMSNDWRSRLGGIDICGVGARLRRGVGSLRVVGVRDVRVVSRGAANVAITFQNFFGSNV